MMRMLLDSSIFIHSEFAQPAQRPTNLFWGDTKQVLCVHGIVRKPRHKNEAYQRQIDALFTVGRLIREGRIAAYDYKEIQFERARGSIGSPDCYALRRCRINYCPTALDRSKFRINADFSEYLSKGGKKDRKAGKTLRGANQIAFFEWLNEISSHQIDWIVRHSDLLKLTEFEVDSLRDIGTFQHLCLRSGSPENYPDVFHLWTTERNGFDAVLTLDKGLPNLLARIRTEKTLPLTIRTQALLPLALLELLGISELDPVPLEEGRFYHFHELP